MTRYEMPQHHTQPVSRGEGGEWLAVVVGPEGRVRLLDVDHYSELEAEVIGALVDLYEDDETPLDVELKIVGVPGIPDVQHAAESVRALWKQSKELREVIRGNHGTAVSLKAEHIRAWRESVRRANGIAFKLGRTLSLAGVPHEDIARLLDVGVTFAPWYAGPHETNRQRHELLDGTTI